MNNNQELHIFANKLIKRLDEIKEITLRQELENWNEEFFTTSSEYLGEFKLILQKVRYVEKMEASLKLEIEEIINKINQAFKDIR